jgi:repressor LexA
MVFADRLLDLIRKRGITKKEFAEAIQINKNQVKRWEDVGTIPNRTTLNAIANYFNVSVAYLKGETDEATPGRIDLSRIGAFVPSTHKVRILGNIACGEPIFADEDFDGYIELDEGIKADFCLHAKGDSMIGARIYDGDIVFVKSQDIVENGEIAVVLIGDEATLKRVAYYPDKNMLILKPENSKYQEMIFIGEELNSVRILGKAVAFQSLVR